MYLCTLQRVRNNISPNNKFVRSISTNFSSRINSHFANAHTYTYFPCERFGGFDKPSFRHLMRKRKKQKRCATCDSICNFASNVVKARVCVGTWCWYTFICLLLDMQKKINGSAAPVTDDRMHFVYLPAQLRRMRAHCALCAYLYFCLDMPWRTSCGGIFRCEAGKIMSHPNDQ